MKNVVHQGRTVGIPQGGRPNVEVALRFSMLRCEAAQVAANSALAITE
jgi:hypothetical protein